MKEAIGGGSLASAYIIDPIVLRLSVAFGALPFTPNQITLASAAIGIGASLLFIFDQWLLGALAIFASMVLDGLDGEVARRKNMKSKYGGFLDATMDRVVDTAVMFGIAFAGAREYGNLAWTIGFFGAVYAGILSSYSAKLLLTIASIDPKWQEEWPRFSDGRDVRLFIIMLGALGNTLVPWSALASVGIVLGLSFTKIVSRLIYYRQRIEQPPSY